MRRNFIEVGGFVCFGPLAVLIETTITSIISIIFVSQLFEYLYSTTKTHFLKRFLFLLIFISTTSWSQSNVQLDSLKRVVYQEQLHDSLIANSYVTLIKHFNRKNQDSCVAYIEALNNYATKNGSSLAKYYYFKYKAGYHGLFVKDGMDSFEFITNNLKKSLEFSKSCDNPKLVSRAFSRLSEEYQRFGYSEEALNYANKGVEYAETYGLWQEVAYIYASMGGIYLDGYKMVDKSLQYFLKSDSIYRENKYQGDDFGLALAGIGDLYKELGNIKEAEAYHRQAYELFLKNNNDYQAINVLGALASDERVKKNYQQAILYFEECIEFYKKNKFSLNHAMYHIGFSDVYFESGQIQKAIEIAQKAITLNQNLNNDFGVLLGSINKSRFLLAAGNYSESYELAKEAKALADDMDSYIDKRDALDLLYKSSEKLGRFEEAYFFSKEHKRVSDTLVKRENLQQTKDLESRYKNSQQEQEIIVLQSKNQLVEEQKRSQRNLLFSIIGLAFLGIVVLFILFRNRQKTNAKLRELDTAKSTFFENISHEFRTPLSLILGPVEKRLDDNTLQTEDRKELEMIHRNSNRLMDLVNQLLDISKLESKYFNLKVRQGNLSALLRSLAASFQYAAKEKNIQYDVAIPNLENAWFDSDAIEKIVMNLVSNAIKYTPEGGEIKMKASREGTAVKVTIENTGVHFTDKELETLFERFYRTKDQSADATTGSGIGLSLVKDLVELSHGSVRVENNGASNLKFTVILPIEKQEFHPTEIDNSIPAVISNEPDAPILGDPLVADEDAIHDTPTLLVVDDNDDIREFIESSFRQTFKIIEAIDGAKGIELAIEHIPDIIISDIMMPRVSGIELCKQLKEDERTSHIPIVLLTAKVDDATRFKGLEYGADDYILKPFNVKLLEARVNNLFESRAKLRKRYSKEVILRPKEITVNSTDERFIEKVKLILDEKITEDSFSVEEFSQLMHVSRMQLHRKIKSLTGLSASEFIRTERLKLALALLQKKDVNINEICYEIGFNSPSYFARCFKDTYGCSPTEYRERF